MSVQVVIDISDRLAERVRDGSFTAPQVEQAIQRAVVDMGQYSLQLWEQYALERGVRSVGYLTGIANPVLGRVAGSEFGIELTNPYKLAEIIEEGHAAFHLPSRINWSGPKVKQGKNGPYLHIPFRHRAFQTEEQLERSGATLQQRRGMLPPDIYTQAHALKPTLRHNAGPQYDAAGNYRAADQYAWGGRLGAGRSGFTGGRHGLVEHTRGERAVAGGGVNPAWKGSKFGGLFKVGAKGHGSYLTIRTITPTSQGWNIPARVGLHIVARVGSTLNGPIGAEKFDQFVAGHLGVER